MPVKDAELYSLAFDAALAGMAIADLEGELHRVNPAFVDMWGFESESEIVGRSVTEFWADRDAATAVAERVVADGEWEGELRAKRPDGTTFHARASASLVTDQRGDPVYMMSSFVDISDRVARQRELQRTNEHLEQFTRVLSHDLRNPLTVAQGRLELARTDHEDGELADAAQALDRAQDIINDALTLAREGESETDVEPVDLAAIAEEAWAHVPTADGTLVTETTKRVVADESRVTQLLENLLRNAVDHGGASVTVTVGDIEGGFFVADEGAGIPPTEREQVFDVGYSKPTDGTGFGLNIVQQIADAHGWAVEVTASDAGGARFEFTGVETVSTDS
jgi:PAS domain S-box-containing protein